MHKLIYVGGFMILFGFGGMYLISNKIIVTENPMVFLWLFLIGIMGFPVFYYGIKTHVKNKFSFLR